MLITSLNIIFPPALNGHGDAGSERGLMNLLYEETYYVGRYPFYGLYSLS
jgi:hypothetical protein